MSVSLSPACYNLLTSKSSTITTFPFPTAIPVLACVSSGFNMFVRDSLSFITSTKQKLYNGDYYTSTDSSINIAYNRAIHRYQVFPSRDISISINENPRSKENFNTVRLLEIPTSSDDFDQ
jgi:hypothetical protein